MTLFRIVERIVSAPWRGWTGYRLERLRIQAEAQAAPMHAMQGMVSKMADAMGQNATVLQTWLDGFKVHEIPSTSTIRDEDEANAERARHGDDPGVSTLGMSPAEAQALMNDFIEFDRA
jgi:hypothetical protein